MTTSEPTIPACNNGWGGLVFGRNSMESDARAIVPSSSNMLQSNHSAVGSKAINAAKYLFQIRYVVVVEVSTSSKCNKVCQLKHASVARISEIWNINDIAKIPTTCSMALEVGHKPANRGFTPRAIHYHYALVCVTGFVFPHKKGIETFADVLKAIM
jgi:hypothetical protein